MIIPYNRHELYIAALSDDSLTIPDMPYTREEVYLAKINGASVTLPDAPCNRYETYLAKLAGEDVTVPAPVSRLEFFLYAAYGYEITLPSPATREEALWQNYIDTLEALAVATQPTDATVQSGQTATFTVAATGGREPYSYQWQYRTSQSGTWTSVSAPSGKTATYSLTAEMRHNGYQYRCQITDDTAHSVDSNTVTLTVEEGLRITTQPNNITTVAGTNVSFSVAADGGTTPYTYQWYYLTPGGESWTAVSADSGKTATYSLKTATRHNGNQYKCLVTDAAEQSVYSDPATLTVTEE